MTPSTTTGVDLIDPGNGPLLVAFIRYTQDRLSEVTLSAVMLVSGLKRRPE